MTTFKVWPFLISRNRTIDYRVVVAPDFLVRSKQSYLLLNWIKNHSREDIVCTEIKDSQLGILFIAFHKIRAEIDGEKVKDEFGRPIIWIEGFVTKESIVEYKIHKDIFETIQPGLRKEFYVFWNTRENPTIAQSSPISLTFKKSVSQPEPVLPRAESIPGWSSSRKRNSEQIRQLQQERAEISQKYKMGIAISIVGVPLIPLVVGIVVTPIGVNMAITNHKRLSEIDEEIQRLGSEK